MAQNVPHGLVHERQEFQMATQGPLCQRRVAGALAGATAPAANTAGDIGTC